MLSKIFKSLNQQCPTTFILNFPWQQFHWWCVWAQLEMLVICWKNVKKVGKIHWQPLIDQQISWEWNWATRPFCIHRMYQGSHTKNSGTFYFKMPIWAPLIKMSTSLTHTKICMLRKYIVCPKVGTFCVYSSNMSWTCSTCCFVSVLQLTHQHLTFPTKCPRLYPICHLYCPLFHGHSAKWKQPK